MGSRMELFAAIRFDWQRHKLSIRALADSTTYGASGDRVAVAAGPSQAYAVDPVAGWGA